MTLEGFALRDPEGELVARVARLDLGFSPLALLRRRLALFAAGHRPPRSFFCRNRAADLTRALAARDARRSRRRRIRPAVELAVDWRR